MTWNHAKDTALIGLFGAGLSILGFLASKINNIESTQQAQMAVYAVQEEHARRIQQDHEDRLRRLEKR